ncbi:uncharacterized protein B0P05DRAFT_587388 [Gilbertella persicaria]|uniref:uncharacterized protein n=1 Tax=Gilbertella persicaria TaxID=101096 RepID=UPI0022204C3C|nr:uncharacterized protein B0P05DRAFT_587388 [Gilbertella persicaria]KAI8078147.1 hypothetical protein B0P05DRAFT_587388 [Gilbertella persicaria]
MVATRKQRVLPSWLLRLVGISSIATALVGLALYWFKKHPSRRHLTGGDTANVSDETDDLAEDGWSQKILNSLKSTVRKNKKRMTISLKNTVLWNPSPDVDTPIYAFREKSIQLLARLSYLYDIYVIVHVNSEEEKANIGALLANASNVFKELIDPRKIIYCSEEEGKVHIIRHIEPFVHIEGGWEMDDGEEIIKTLKPFVNKIIWLMTRRRRDSFRPENLKQADRATIGQNVEIADSLIDTSVARQVK